MHVCTNHWFIGFRQHRDYMRFYSIIAGSEPAAFFAHVTVIPTFESVRIKSMRYHTCGMLSYILFPLNHTQELTLFIIHVFYECATWLCDAISSGDIQSSVVTYDGQAE